MIDFTNTISVLNDYAQRIKNLYREKNIEAGYDPAAELQNISFNVESDNGNFSMVFHMPDYWRWAENGRGPGKMPPEGVLLRWMEFKQILPSQVQLPDGRSYLPSMKSLEYLIRRKIGREGTQGQHTWEATENEIKESLIRDVKAALEQDFNMYLETRTQNLK